MDETIFVIIKFQFDFALEVWFSIYGKNLGKIIFLYLLQRKS